MNYRTDTPYDFDTQNESRADQAERALAVATDRNGEDDPADVLADVSDLLANVIHFCARAGLDWDALVGQAERAASGDLEDGPEAVRDTDRFPAACSSDKPCEQVDTCPDCGEYLTPVDEA